jgi:ribosome-interacting GTPase 1
MPANLPPQYNKAEDEYRRAAAPAERLEKLREMFRLLPKHKGTEKLQSDLKQKISRAREEIDHAKSGARKAGPSYRVPHEGAGQVALLGGPNVGKSSLVAALTHAHPDVAAYPFTTRVPQPGMMAWEDVHVQLVDLPPVTADFLEQWMIGIVRSADAALLVADLSDDCCSDASDAVLERLAGLHTELVGTLPFDVDDESVRHLHTLLVANKSDAPGAAERLEWLRECYAARFPICTVSATSPPSLDPLRRNVYDLLGVIRVYTKVPGKPADRTHPFTLHAGGTIHDLTSLIHRDLEHSVKFARIWGSGVFDGQTVKRDHELHDGDVVELHT